MNILIFGTGKTSNKLIKLLKKRNIIAYVDNDSKKIGRIYESKRIISPNDIRNYKYDYIIIASQYYIEITLQLSSLGVNLEKIVPYFPNELRNKKYMFNFEKLITKWSKLKICIDDLIGYTDHFMPKLGINRLKSYGIAYTHFLIEIKKSKRIDIDDNIAKLKKEKKLLVLQTPNHGNLGDQAIAYAQEMYLKNNFDSFYYIEIPFCDVIRKIKYIKLILNKRDIIFIHGGGNLGDIYFREELVRRLIIKSFHRNNIISFPQTFFFSNSLIGKIELLKSRIVYRRNQNLTILAREKKSYELMKQQFTANEIMLVPDIVLTLKIEKKNKYRSGILMSLRNDSEQDIDRWYIFNLIRTLINRNEKITYADTVVNGKVCRDDRVTKLKKIWSVFSSSEVVITDRLHGMIFAAITCTPCIAFNNNNHKIKYSYKSWLYKSPYIYFCDELIPPLDIINKVNSLRKLNARKLNSLDFTNHFIPLTKRIEEIISAKH
ncbi:MAG: polysaccharide pyruvyl transferase family protein [Sporolactobacillus sp.]|jgi:pyruvyl transferase EpsI|nr:polysaccharide pyruvyl transferase family protein [Sporolactobacillus sp.]